MWMAHLTLKFKTLISFSTLFFFFFFPVFSTELGDEEAAFLLKLRDALTPAPSDWFNNTYMCEWSRVSCGFDINSNSHYVEGITLDSMSLTGTLPSSLNNALSRLRYLYLSNNSLSGPLPSLANLRELETVALGSNNFTSIPEGCFQSLEALQSLSVGYNTNLAPWTFPTELWYSSQLFTLDLAATNLMGSLPDIFDSLPNLQAVYLSNNNLSGVLPKSFARSKIGLLRLNDQNYKLSGTIEVLSSMTNLIDVELQGNRLEGPIPDLSNCTDLQFLLLEDNRLTGVVPPSLMSLSSLVMVSLGHNLLQGPLPVFKEQVNVSLGVNTSNNFCLHHAGPCDQQVTILLEIAAGFGYPSLLARSWRGSNPCQHWSFIVCDGGKIKTVNLTKQNLRGTISPAFGNLTNLWNLYLAGNNLRGPIPESLATLSQLKVLDVSNNKLSGHIPRFSSRVLLTTTGNAQLDLSQANATSPTASETSLQANATSPTASITSHSPPWIAGASVGGVGVIVIFVAIIYNRKRCLSLIQKMMLKETRTFVDHNVVNLIKSYGSLAPKQYSYTEVKRMTNSFCEKLGQGGYGIVYRASLTDGRQVAVKVLKESKGSAEEFVNEVVTISRTSHVNIVSLLGFCYEMNKRALIYEFMSNGSLDKFTYGQGSSNAICNLDWSAMYQITISIARGLEYLHRGCNTRILHLDIKPQNILLDESFRPKIADFGLAKICKMDESIVSILGTRGTPGYIAPEVFSRTYGGVSHKSDVYSYGMLILEMVGGRKNYESGGSHTSEVYFPDWIYKDLDQGNIPARYLPNTKEENDMVMKITLVSLWCIQPKPSNRPSMSKVVEMLEGPLQSVPYPPKPILYSPERPPIQFSDVSYSSAHEANSMTTEENGSVK